MIGFSQALMDGALISDEDRGRAAFAINEAGWRSVRLLERVLSTRGESVRGGLSMGTRDLGMLLDTSSVDVYRSGNHYSEPPRRR